MAKKKASSKPRTSKPAVPGAVRRITHRTIMDGVEGAASYKVYGIAKKGIIQDTTFGRIPGLKGTFEAVTPKGEILSAKRCFLPIELHGDVLKKLGEVTGKEGVSFGATVEVDANDATTAAFFAQPQQTDPMANLREEAQEL